MASIQEEKYRVGKRPQCSFFEAELARIALVLILLAMTPMAYAQSCTFNWTGTWDSRYGELRLIQSGSNVYGDYASVGALNQFLKDVGTTLVPESPLMICLLELFGMAI